MLPRTSYTNDLYDTVHEHLLVDLDYYVARGTSRQMSISNNITKNIFSAKCGLRRIQCFLNMSDFLRWPLLSSTSYENQT